MKKSEREEWEEFVIKEIREAIEKAEKLLREREANPPSVYNPEFPSMSIRRVNAD
ncbi:MAG: hypothetical protein ACTSRF_09285 [Candidatus Freyarchaeota archaeon]